MSDCEHIQRQFQAYLDGELEAAEREAVQAHLTECAACRELAASYERLFAALDEPALPEPAPGLPARVMQRVAMARARRRRLQTLVAAAAVLVVCAASMLWAWEELPSDAWGHVADLGRLELWAAVSDAFTAFAAGVSSAGETGLALAPGAPTLAILVAALFALNLALAYRWRALARLNGNTQARAIR